MKPLRQNPSTATRLVEFATGRKVVAALLILLVGTAGVFTLGPYRLVACMNDNGPMPEEQLFTAAYVAVFLTGIGPQGRELYAFSQLVDVFNPLL